MKTTNTTPGYNIRLQVAFKSDRYGRRLAFYWSGRGFPGSFGRWIRMGLDAADLFIAQEQADQVQYVKPMGGAI